MSKIIKIIIPLAIILVFVTLLILDNVNNSNNLDSGDDSTINFFNNSKFFAVVPHHDIVAKTRSDLFNEISKKNNNVETIILISPDHFYEGGPIVKTTDKDWLINNGEDKIFGNNKVINKIVTDLDFVGKHDKSFEDEHGIKNILKDIGNHFPDSKIVPILIKEGTPKVLLDDLFDSLDRTCAGCSVISSVDMSHYLPARLAELKDIKTLRVLHELDLVEILESEVDSPETLYLLIRFAKQAGLNNFFEFAHTNSGFIEGNYFSETTTHIFGWFDKNNNSDIEKEDPVTFSFVGDIMLGRFVGSKFQDDNFKDLVNDSFERAFWGTDISWGNLEGPISDKKIEQNVDENDLSFLFSNEAINALKEFKLNVVGLSNNHTLNDGEEGFKTTTEVLDKNGISWHGHPSEYNKNSVYRFDNGDVKVSLIGVHTLYGLSEADLANIDSIIKNENDSGYFVIVLPHWGIEYNITHSLAQEKYATRWVNSGAGLIIGTHPHVIQDSQVIYNKNSEPVLVFYSLGNFVFDQYFSDETQTGLLLSGALSSDNLEIRIFALNLKKIAPNFADKIIQEKIVKRVCGNILDFCDINSGVINLDI